jgi:hypothetical protein
MEKEEIKREIAERLKALRMAASEEGYATFSINNDISKNTLFRVESTGNMTIDTLIELLKIYNISLEEFFKGL